MEPRTRRHILAAGCTMVAGGIAGCSTDDSSDNTDSPDSPDEESENGRRDEETDTQPEERPLQTPPGFNDDIGVDSRYFDQALGVDSRYFNTDSVAIFHDIQRTNRETWEEMEYGETLFVDAEREIQKTLKKSSDQTLIDKYVTANGTHRAEIVDETAQDITFDSSQTFNKQEAYRLPWLRGHTTNTVLDTPEEQMASSYPGEMENWYEAIGYDPEAEENEDDEEPPEPRLISYTGSPPARGSPRSELFFDLYDDTVYGDFYVSSGNRRMILDVFEDGLLSRIVVGFTFQHQQTGDEIEETHTVLFRDYNHVGSAADPFDWIDEDRP